MAESAHRFRYPGPPEEFAGRVVPLIVVPSLAPTDWSPRTLEDRLASFQRERRSGWIFVLCVALFPVGLLSLLISKTRQTITLAWTADGEHTDVVATTDAGRDVRRYLPGIDGHRLHTQVHEIAAPLSR